MVRFKIQSKSLHRSEKRPAYDFCFHLLEAIEYHNWINNNQEMRYDLTPMFAAMNNNMIPIGSVEFVHSYMNWFNIPIPKPINIPEELRHPIFTDREVFIGRLSDIKKRSFVKSINNVKGNSGIVEPKYIPDWLLEKDNPLFISEYVDNIESEWRGFVHNGKLVDIRNYSGDPQIFPDVSAIGEMIDVWRDAPIAYTIDVAICLRNYKRATVLIECHNFYSCGLYGFKDHRKLPVMFSQWWYEYLTKNNIKWSI